MERECSKGRRIAYTTAVLDSKRRHLLLALAISCSLRYMAIGWRLESVISAERDILRNQLWGWETALKAAGSYRVETDSGGHPGLHRHKDCNCERYLWRGYRKKTIQA